MFNKSIDLEKKKIQKWQTKVVKSEDRQDRGQQTRNERTPL